MCVSNTVMNNNKGRMLVLPKRKLVQASVMKKYENDPKIGTINQSKILKTFSLQTCSPQLTVIWNSFAEYILAIIEVQSSSYEFLKSCSQF